VGLQGAPKSQELGVVQILDLQDRALQYVVPAGGEAGITVAGTDIDYPSDLADKVRTEW
jgi:hypothetical protein